jgi:DNA replication protein DnaC
MANSLMTTLKKLRLSGLAEALEMRLHEAATSGLNHRDFLELLLQDELLLRNQRLVGRRMKAANFRDVRRLEDFDFAFNPSIRKDRIYDLATCRFIRERRDSLLVGPPGTGKSHLAQAIGMAAIRSGYTVFYRSIFDTVRDFLHDEALSGQERTLQRYLKPDLLIIDDMGMKQLPKRS